MGYVGQAPSAGGITTADIVDNQVTLAKVADIARGSMIVGNASAATAELTKGSASTVLTSDGTDIAWAAAAGGAISNIQVWHLTSALATSASTTNYLSGFTKMANTGYGEIGADMAESGTIWTFPTTGLWKLTYFGDGMVNSGSTRMNHWEFLASVNANAGSPTYASSGFTRQAIYDTGSGNSYGSAVATMLFNVTSVATHKFKLSAYTQDVAGYISTAVKIMFERVGEAD